MKAFLTFIFAFTLSPALFSNPLFQYQSSGILNTGIYLLNNNTGYLTGANGNIIKTTNGGVTWEYQGNYSNQHLYNVKFINDNTGFTISTGGYFWRTTNGGNRWSAAIITSSPLFELYFPSSLTGWVSGMDGIIRKTTNGGFNWITQSSGTNNTIPSMYFADENTGWACTYDDNSNWPSTILYTSNSGSTWQAQLTASTLDLHAIAFSSNVNGWCGGAQGSLYKTTNGSTWQSTGSGVSGTIRGIHFIDNSTGFFTAGTGLYKTTNSGTNWNQVLNDINILYRIRFSDLNTGYVSGYNGTIYKTTNSGNNWNLLNRGINRSLNSVFFTSALTGYAAGIDNMVKTTNGGLVWEPLSEGSLYKLNSIYFVNETTGWGVGLNGTSVYTTNAGSNWNVRSFGGFDFYTVYFQNENTGWAGGEYTYKTTNGGLNWTIQPLELCHAVHFVNSQTGWASYWNGIGKTTNGGNNWTNYSFSAWPVSIDFFDINTGICSVALEGSVHFTVNSGLNWVNRTPAAFDDYHSTKMFSSSNAVTIGARHMAYTNNSGATWRIDTIPGFPAILSAAFINANTGWLVGESGIILKTTDAGNFTSISQNSELLPLRNSYTINYPNPFNPLTNILFEIGENAENVSVDIYDLNGKFISNIYYKNMLQSGKYEVRWDGSNFASGIYIYTVKADNAILSFNKMILIK